MYFVLSRLLYSLPALLLGAALGYLLGLAFHAPVFFTLFGVVLGVAVLLLIDALRARRLLLWLTGPQAGLAPRSKGYWGELAYRIERSLRLLERQAAVEKLRLEQFLSAIEASPNGVLLLDANEAIQWCNSVAADHFGLNPDRDRLQPVTNLVRAPEFVTHLQAGRFDEPVQLNDMRGRAALSILIRPYGEGLKLVLSQDVTERERTDGMRRDFVANVSHEIRTPLTVLSGFIETMSDLPLTEVERKRVLLLMAQQTQRMQTLVSDLLTLAQLEGSPRPAADRWVPLAKLLGQVHADGVALSRGRHEIKLTGADETVQLAGNENELLSAISNLVSNAVRYTPEGGQVSIVWRVRPDGAGELAVADTGPGIAREHLPRLTERFYRVDGSRSRDTGGTGLGLSIVKHVVQRHGGEFDIQSELGKGSRFALVFPASRVRSDKPGLPLPAAAGEQVLVH
jgi:two-component system, OmpR family, phosphate regulon sensor histidine kinase PhoR